jgi:hypothetical protein
MLLIAYQGIFNGQNYDQANTPNQIGLAFNHGYSVSVDVWRVNGILYLGTDQPLTEVTPDYLKGNRFWINARNVEMQEWISTQPIKSYPNYFWYDITHPPPYVTTSGGQLWTFGTVPVNNSSIVVLPEINDRGLLSTVKLNCYGICSTYPTFIRRMRTEGNWY